jgi:hypothetical protein
MNGQNISVIDPVSTAIEKTKEILFKPFDLGKWFVIGFCAWLAYLGEGGGGGGGGNYNFPNKQQTAHDLNSAKEFVLENLPIVISVSAAIVFVIIVLTVLFIWLRSRGKFMFLHCVALNVAEVKVPWEKYASHANSLFLFLLILGILGFVCFIPMIAILLFIAMGMANNGLAVPIGIMAIVCTVLVMIIIGILFGLVGIFTKDFVVPIMYLRGCTCTDGWRAFWKMLTSNKGKFVLYILFQFVLGLAIGAIIFVIVLATCCCAGCLLAIPYIGTVLLLPILVFRRSYSLCYFAQYGGEYNVFPVPEALNPGQELVQ